MIKTLNFLSTSLRPQFALHSYYFSLPFAQRRSFSSVKSDTYMSDKKFSDLSLTPELAQALKKNNFIDLTLTQSIALQSVLEGKNTLVQGETGSGKTLCYIVPILNEILQSLSKTESSGTNDPRGALVMAPNKELCSQVYSVFKALDLNDQVRITRLGSLNNLAPLVVPLNQDKRTKQVDSPTLGSVETVVAWKNLDVLISTPVQLWNLLKVQEQRDPYDMNPKFIVMDEYDLLFGDTTIARATRNILDKFTKKGKKKRQFILCGASAPKKIGSVKLQEEVESWFPQIQIAKTDRFHKLPEAIKYEYIEIEPNTSEEKELLMLSKLLKISEAKKVLVFCNSNEKVKTVCEFLEKRGLSCVAFSAGLPAEERVQILYRYNSEDIRVLVSTDLASRGIDFKDVDQVVQFEFGTHATTVLHRAGRTGRCGRSGKFTSFVRENDQLLASKLEEIVTSKEEFDEAFSHKRSLRKKERRRQVKLDEDTEASEEGKEA